MVGVHFFPSNGPGHQTQPSNQEGSVSSSGVKNTNEIPPVPLTPEALTLEGVADPIIQAVEEKYYEPLAIMIARAYEQADHEKKASAFLKKLSDNQKQIIELIKTGATPADLFCFGICLWIQSAEIFKKRLNTYCLLKIQNIDIQDPASNFQRALCFINEEKNVKFSREQLKQCFNSTSGFADLITAVHKVELLEAYKTVGSTAKASACNQNSSACHPVNVFVAAGNQINNEFIEGKQSRFHSKFHKSVGSLHEHDNKVKPNTQPALTRDSFLLLLKAEIYEDKWKTLGRFGRRVPDGIQKLRDLFSNNASATPNLANQDLFTQVMDILESKQYSYVGFGLRADATTRFYQEQYSRCMALKFVNTSPTYEVIVITPTPVHT